MMATEHELNELLEQFYQCLPENALSKMRTKAWERFQEIGLPTSKETAFRYIPLRKFYSQSFVKAQVPSLSDVHDALVFVNGQFAPELSNAPKRVIVTSLDEAASSYGALLNNHWTRMLQEERDPFALINACLHEKGAFIYLPPKTLLENPLHIVHLIDTQDTPQFLLPRITLFVGAHSEVEILLSQVRLSGGQECINSVLECIIEEESHVQITQASTRDPETVWRFEALRASLKRNSTLNLVSLTEGTASTRKDYRVALTGENCEANLNGLSMLEGRRESHTYVLIDHQAPHCRSRQLFKNVLNDTSRSSFEGKILVRQAAQKTDAFQLNNNLLLSDRAAADSKPNLEIFADDVKASHGATFGQLDVEQLFMLKSRGISETEAKKLLVQGFCKEILDLVQTDG